jgi:hypothetical protein
MANIPRSFESVARDVLRMIQEDGGLAQVTLGDQTVLGGYPDFPANAYEYFWLKAEEDEDTPHPLALVRLSAVTVVTSTN